jgi:hypothetical protein
MGESLNLAAVSSGSALWLGHGRSFHRDTKISSVDADENSKWMLHCREMT